LNRFQNALLNTLTELNFQGQTRASRHGIWDRNGQLVNFGVASKNWITYHGAFINVDPQLHMLRMVQCDPWERTPQSSLAAQRRQPIKMARIREALVRHLTGALGCGRYHLYTGHPLLAYQQAKSRRLSAKAG
jgi:lipoate-protein ligase B